MTDTAWLPRTSRLRSRDFTFGVATAAFQIEGSTEVDGRLPSIWDTYCDAPGKVANGDTGKVACDHYRRWKDDIELIESLKVDAYRLSIAWPRLITRDGRANEKGFDFYKRLLNALGEKNIKRFVTLYHWDLPQWIEDRGGWISRETAYRYAEYVDIATRQLAGMVEAWTTFNEPWCSAWIGYAEGRQAPGHRDPQLALTAGHHLMLGHGLAVPIIRANDPGARVGIVLNLQPATPATDKTEDRRAAKLAEVGQNDWFLSPLLKGEYDARIFELRGSAPAILPGDLDTICQPMDYLGVNYYFRSYVEAAGAHGYRDVPLRGVERTQMGWEVYPEGLTYQLTTIKADYPNLPPIYITENGMASDDKVVDGVVDDESRITFFKRHLNAVDAAIEAGVRVEGYFVWSLMDNFEWGYGYEKRFGICHIDYDTQVRTPKESALWLRDFFIDRA